MLNRIKQSLQKSIERTVKTQSSQAGRRFRTGTRQEKVVVPAPVAAAAPAAPTSDKAKWIRGGIFFLMFGYYFSKTQLSTDNPNSFLNKVLYPNRKGKWMLKVERIDDSLSNYETSFLAVEKGLPAAIKHQARRKALNDIGLQISQLPLTPAQIQAIIAAGKQFREQSKLLAARTETASKSYIEITLAETSEKVKNLESKVKDAKETKEEAKKEGEKSKDNVTKIELSEKASKAHQELLVCLDSKINLETMFMVTIESILTKDQKTKLAYEKDPDIVARIKNSVLQLNHGKYEFLLEKLSELSVIPAAEKPKIFVLRFDGDVMANQVARLREEITAILNFCDAERGDRVVLQLNSPGGTVTGYGLAAAQLLRVKQAGLPLTIAVDQVAASGGYQMACVGDEIIASPFAMIGSIGVVTTIPNFSERLQREGVVVEDLTAGKYKRTLTPYKKATEEDRKKVQSELEQILSLFKNFVKTNRPKVDIDTIATGEVWLATDALKKGLVDSIMTADDLLLKYRQDGYEVFRLNVKPIMPAFGEPLDEADQISMSTEDGSWTSTITYHMKQFFISVFSSVLHDFMNKSSWMQLEETEIPSSFRLSTHTDGTMNQYNQMNGTNGIHTRYLAIDPNQSYPPKMM